MTKMSEARKIVKEIIDSPKEPRAFTSDEILELQEFHRTASVERFKANLIKNNTALVPDGQKVAEQAEAIARLVENFKQQWISQTLAKCGYSADQKVNINLKTGEIILVKNA